MSGGSVSHAIPDGASSCLRDNDSNEGHSTPDLGSGQTSHIWREAVSCRESRRRQQELRRRQRDSSEDATEMNHFSPHFHAFPVCEQRERCSLHAVVCCDRCCDKPDDQHEAGKQPREFIPYACRLMRRERGKEGDELPPTPTSSPSEAACLHLDDGTQSA